MAETTQPLQDREPQPHIENRLNNLSVNSTWTEILNAITELEAKISKMELTPNVNSDKN